MGAGSAGCCGEADGFADTTAAGLTGTGVTIGAGADEGGDWGKSSAAISGTLGAGASTTAGAGGSTVACSATAVTAAALTLGVCDPEPHVAHVATMAIPSVRPTATMAAARFIVVSLASAAPGGVESSDEASVSRVTGAEGCGGGTCPP